MTQAPIRISWTSLKTWEGCRTKYRMTYHEKRWAHDKDTRVFLAGTVADRIMRAWLESDDPQPGQMASWVDEFMERHTHGEEAEGVRKWRGDPREDYARIRDKVERTVTRLEPWLIRYVLPHEYHPELRFETWLHIPAPGGEGKMPVLLVGGIDIAVRFAPPDDEHPVGRYRLHDLKTTESSEYVRKTLGQSTFYDIAFGSWIGNAAQPEGFSFVFPLLDEQFEIRSEITNDHRRDMLERIVRMAHGVAQRQWGDPVLPEDEGMCWGCEVRAVCPVKTPVSHADEFGRRRASFLGTAARRARAQQEAT